MTRFPDPGAPTLPPPVGEDLDGETLQISYSSKASVPVPHLVRIAGPGMGRSLKLDRDEILIGRAQKCQLQIDEFGVSRSHARIVRIDGQFVIEDLASSNGTLLNGVRLVEQEVLEEGDKIQVGQTVMRFALFDSVDVDFHQVVDKAISMTESQRVRIDSSIETWAVDSWRTKQIAQEIHYDDPDHLERVMERLRRMPPLVTPWEVDSLKQQIADAQDGHRFFLQGGDCLETLADCEPGVITNKLTILIQMSLVLMRGTRLPIVRVGRFAGQYAKPRSKMTEVRDGVELPSYFGDLVNRPEFSVAARRPDPELLLTAHQHAAVTLNFIHGLSDGGFADLRRPEYFDLSLFQNADLPASLKIDYNRVAKEVADGMHALRAVHDGSPDRRSGDHMRAKFFTSHDGLSLHYESAQTRRVPRKEGFYDLTTHLPWIGERTRARDGAHVEFFRGITNPVGVKVGPTADPDDIVDLVSALNPRDERGKIVLITRLGAAQVAKTLPPLLAAIRRAGRRVLWVSDPMHGNGTVTPSGVKARNFDDILAELEQTIEVHQTVGSIFGGVHVEFTGEDVTECMGGGVAEVSPSRNHATVCDPRLNYRQAIQMAFSLAEKLRQR